MHWQCALTAASLVSRDKPKHPPAPPFEKLITHTGKLVTATVRVDLSHCKVEAYFEHLVLFSESSESGIVWARYWIRFLAWLSIQFCWQSVFPCRYKQVFCDKAKFSGFSNMVTQMRRHFKDYSIHLGGQIDTFLFHCQCADLMLFSLWNDSR